MSLFDMKNVRAFADLLATCDDASVNVANTIDNPREVIIKATNPGGVIMPVVLAVALKARFGVLLTKNAAYTHVGLTEGSIKIHVTPDEIEVIIIRK